MKNIFCFLLLSISISSYAQNEFDNMHKYWYYRFRMKNDFMLLGKGQGMSIPAAQRDVRGQNFPYSEEHQLDWGDATTDLGWYIGVLATEYRLLRDNSQPTDTTLMELYYALEAFNRLDNTAESYFRCSPLPCPVSNPLPGDLNGWFIPDDVPADFLDNTPEHPHNREHFNQGIASTSMVDKLHSDFLPTYGTHPNPYPSVESEDQAIHMLIGLSLVNRCFDAGVTYNNKSFLDGETDILYEAHNITDRIISWMQDHNWTIENPVTHHVETLEDGGLPYLMAYGFAEAACKATGKNDGTHAITGRTCNEYHDLITDANLVFFHGLQGPLELIAISPARSGYNDHIVGILAACGNSWYEGYPFVVNTTNEALSLFFTTYHDREYLPLLRQVLHGGGNLVPNSTYENLLDRAPCVGPYNFGGSNHPINARDDWSSAHRFKDPENRGDYPDGDKTRGEYYGLDYMLLFNLYCLANDDYLTSYYNEMDQMVTIDFPHGLLAYEGSTANPKEIDAFNTITAGNHINSGNNYFTNGDVVYRAGEEIALLPGFGVDEGADFGAYIDPFHCSGNDYSRMASDSSKPTSRTYNMPTSYVYYTDAGKNTIHPYVSSFSQSPEKIINNAPPQINIMPNPSFGIFTLQLTENTTGEIFIYNELGQVIYRATNQPINQSAIDLSSQPKGIYFLKVQSEEGVFMEKVVVQ